MWLDEISSDDITKVINTMSESKVLGVDLNNELRQPEKKNNPNPNRNQ